ncbi:hypothetical protein EYF80_060706 [Liparis tanakae]|uniref:Uncharacterized protein n=1 Tax=Liparis tanakae TaxID=230148 RepID=A0A4Z2EK64_9TELE|nr:hypothetical protein EYF80_060706 [Liparis tanakae]
MFLVEGANSGCRVESQPSSHRPGISIPLPTPVGREAAGGLSAQRANGLFAFTPGGPEEESYAGAVSRCR